MAKNCRRCNKAVYHAEEARGAGTVWHKVCFKCKECKKKLDSTVLAVHDGEIYCKSCHGRKFGPKGYGFGGGAGALSMEQVDSTNTPHKNDYDPSKNYGGGRKSPAGRSNGGGFGGGGASSGGGKKFCGACGTPANGKFCQECGQSV